jgi:hypothetical protein
VLQVEENGEQSEGVLAIHDDTAWSISAIGECPTVLAVRAPGIHVEEDGDRASWPFTTTQRRQHLVRSISTQGNKRAARLFTTA